MFSLLNDNLSGLLHVAALISYYRPQGRSLFENVLAKNRNSLNGLGNCRSCGNAMHGKQCLTRLLEQVAL